MQTSKRATRRPQTLAQATYAVHHPTQRPSSPFTHAPLPHRASPASAAPAQHQPYGYPYAYTTAYPGYAPYASYLSTAAGTPGNNTPSVTAAKTTVAVKTVATADAISEKVKEKTDNGASAAAGANDEAGDAWVAAQHILQAINFAGSSSQPESSSSAAVSNGVQPPIMDSLDINYNLNLDRAVGTDATGDHGLGRAALTDEERAALQAQLALLAAQLSEIADLEDDGVDTDVTTEHMDQPLITEQPPQRVLIDVNQFPDVEINAPTAMDVHTVITATLPSLTSNGISALDNLIPMPAGGDLEEDEEMEMVDVDDPV
ncbi:hypothetical protein EW026_g6939 [Hermanssonia centrifuga]|uniref:Uncharacterized protein n=1 Tax=Hermanssonia centrifuga TaxID=98765 RepID=A0A4S4K9G7_9APHY|nr:hypothetical protein EW026_g6939 [Hermanssonia centrifuga]